MNEPTFVICDCIIPPLALALKEPFSQKDSLLSALAVKASKTSTSESVVKADKESVSEATNNQSGIALGTIFFAFDSAKLTKNAISKIDKIVGSINSEGLRNITVNGYTCDIGSKKYNDNLAQKRADAVTSYLKLKGVDVSISKGGIICLKKNFWLLTMSPICSSF